MLDLIDIKNEIRDVAVLPVNVEIYVDEYYGAPLTLDLPSPMDMVGLHIDERAKISLQEVTSNIDLINLKGSLEHELERLIGKNERFKNSASYHSHLANLYEIADEKEKAIFHRRKAIEYSDSCVFHHKLAISNLKNSNVDEALSILESSTLNDDMYSLLRLANISVVKGDIDLATSHVRRALEIDCLDHRAQMFMGAISLFDGDPMQAIRHFKVSLEGNPKSSNLYVNLAMSYCQLNQKKQTLTSLRKAIQLNPFNENALVFFADVAFEERLLDESVGILEKYTNYERKSGAIWERLARAYFFLPKSKNNNINLYKALDALKFQNSIAPTPSVFNNIGLIYNELNDTDKALRFLNLSIKASNEKEHIHLVLNNMIPMFLQKNKPQEALLLIEPYVENILIDDNYSFMAEKLNSNYVKCLERSGHKEDGIKFISKVWDKTVSKENKLEYFIFLIYYYSVDFPSLDKISSFTDEIIELIDMNDKHLENLQLRVLNNLIFALFLHNKNELAFDLLPMILNKVNSDPFITATFGMACLKKGHLDKGKDYYQKALTLVASPSMKHYFKQRMNLELGRANYLNGDMKKANRYLIKAKNEKNGLESVNKQVLMLIEKSR
jgi:tetratricopeptide (TPR) repeat protein